MNSPQITPEAADDIGGHQTNIRIRDFRALNKNSLKAVFTAVLPSGMIISGCMLHESDGRRWIGLPGRPYTDISGKQTWTKIIDFVSRAVADRFGDAVLAALDEHAHLAEAAE